MNRFDRIYQLNTLIKNACLPASKAILKNQLECSDSSIEHSIENLRDHLSAPLVYNKKLNGYHYAETGDRKYELPGLWFNAAELFALLASQQLLKDIQPGLLEDPIKPLTQKIQNLLRNTQLGHKNIEQRVKLIQQSSRNVDKTLFQKIISAIATRKKIQCTYHARGTDEISNRTLSLQRIVHYRDNWYLDAWCHKREALRTFSVEKIISGGVLTNDAIDIEQSILDAHFTSSLWHFFRSSRQNRHLRIH